MYTRQHFRLRSALLWTYPIFIVMGLYSASLCALHELGDLDWLHLPALPVTVLGTAVSFYLGFKGNAAYGRLWEARKIWGGIVNTSRTWGIHVTGMVTGEGASDVHRAMIYRHVAWLAALRIRLRRPKPWEHRQEWNDVWRRAHQTFDTSNDAIRAAIGDLLDPAELDGVIDTKNQATQLLKTQSDTLRELHERGAIDDFRHMELAGLLEEMFTLQGKAERIKAFPCPASTRQPTTGSSTSSCCWYRWR